MVPPRSAARFRMARASPAIGGLSLTAAPEQTSGRAECLGGSWDPLSTMTCLSVCLSVCLSAHTRSSAS